MLYNNEWNADDNSWLWCIEIGIAYSYTNVKNGQNSYAQRM